MLNLILSFLFFAVIHSITAAQWFKDLVRQAVGPPLYRGWYRLLYNIFSVLTLLPVGYFYLLLPLGTAWRVPAPLSWLFVGVQLVGLAGLTVSVLQSGAFAFIGLSQLIDYVSNQTRPAQSGLGETLVVDGLYRYIRHPLYTFSLLLLWFSPVMSVNLLIFTVLATGYFVFGSIIEERRLIHDFGESYREYRRTVSRFVPGLNLLDRIIIEG